MHFTKWYRINADDVVEGNPELYVGAGLSLFHDGVGSELELPSLSPDGRLLATLAYLPNEQRSTLMVLFQETDSFVDICLHGWYDMQPLDTSSYHGVGVWSPDSQYIAFAVHGDERSGLYVYDPQKHIVGLIDRLEAPRVEIVGWGL